LWRVDWLLHWLAISSMPSLLYFQFRRDGAVGVRFWSLLVIMFLGTQNRMAPEMVFVVYALIPVFIFWPKIETQVGRGFRIGLLGSMPMALLIATCKAEVQIYHRYMEILKSGGSAAWHYAALSNPLIFCGFIFLLFYSYRQFPRLKYVFLFLIFSGAWYSLSIWDHRSDWTRAIEGVSGEGREFGVDIEPGAQVFWSNETLAPWLVLHRANYFSTAQTAGVLFNRGTAAEVMRRGVVINQLNQGVDACKDTINSDTESTSCDLQKLTLKNFCKAAQPDVQYVILDFIASEKYAGSWAVGANYQGRDLNYYLYRCSDIISDNSGANS